MSDPAPNPGPHSSSGGSRPSDAPPIKPGVYIDLSASSASKRTVDLPPPKLPPPKIEKPISLRDRYRKIDTSGILEVRKSIKAIGAATRTPWGEIRELGPDQIAEIDQKLKQLEIKLSERERLVSEMEQKIAERERDLAEMETLADARIKLLEASKLSSPKKSAPVSDEERAALSNIKAELERQEKSLGEQRDALREREVFIEDNETKLFAKMQEQQERSLELEQKAEDLKNWQNRLKKMEAALDPEAAKRLAAEEAANKRDEFRE